MDGTLTIRWDKMYFIRGVGMIRRRHVILPLIRVKHQKCRVLST